MTAYNNDKEMVEMLEKMMVFEDLDTRPIHTTHTFTDNKDGTQYEIEYTVDFVNIPCGEEGCCEKTKTETNKEDDKEELRFFEATPLVFIENKEPLMDEAKQEVEEEKEKDYMLSTSNDDLLDAVVRDVLHGLGQTEFLPGRVKELKKRGLGPALKYSLMSKVSVTEKSLKNAKELILSL